MMAREDFVVWPRLAPLLEGMRQGVIQNAKTVIKSVAMQLVHGYSPGPSGSLEARVRV